MDKSKKTDTINKFQSHEGDTGSTEVQVALLTERIKQLTGHMVVNRHDFPAKRTLIMLGGRRKRLLAYLSREGINRYRSLITQLGLRK